MEDFSKELEDFKKKAREYAPRHAGRGGKEGAHCGVGTCPLRPAQRCSLTQDDIWVTSWKEISRYTGLGINTLIRAAKRGDFPIKKLGTKGGYVTVKKTDLDAWRETTGASSLAKGKGRLTKASLEELCPHNGQHVAE